MNYKCRLILGGNSDIASQGGREWNTLMYNICRVADGGTGLWDTQTTNFLGLNDTRGNRNICQEVSYLTPTPPLNSNTKVIDRGYGNITGFQQAILMANNADGVGWRPVLEVIA